MQRHGRIFAIQLFRFRHVAVDDSRVFTMRHDGERGVFEDFLQHLSPIYQHVSRARPHKKLNARNAVRIELSQ